jgi:5'-3' exonuclease
MFLSVCLSHLMGLFYRTIRIVENGIKPAYVFDGKPPDLKAGIVRLNLFSLHTLWGLMARRL